MRLFIILFLIISPTLAYAYEVDDIITFAAPDSSYSALIELIDNASSIYINGYTFESTYLSEKLIGKEKDGSEVIIILEGSPVGGLSINEKNLLEEMSSSGVALFFNRALNISFNHAKYIIADNNTVLITTENFGETGFPRDGSHGNRGLGVILADRNLAMFFVELFFRDLNMSKRITELSGFKSAEFTVKKNYKAEFSTERYHGRYTAIPVVAPEDAVEGIIRLIESANESVYIEQMYIYRFWGSKREGYRPNKFLEASIDAARKGCVVKILMDSTWYNILEDDPQSNLKTAKYVNSLAKREGLDIEARLIDLDKAGFEKLHAKSVIVDGKIALISSINWNEHSPTKNREVGIIINGEPVEFYRRVFLSDWAVSQDKKSPKPVLLIMGVISIIILIAWWEKK